MSARGFTHESAGSPDWYTPPEIFSALGLRFDLDPCAPALPIAEWLPVDRRISLPDDGLAESWTGRVWLNPPYGVETGRWVGRLAAHGDGISLTFTRTDTPWWQSTADRASLVCFIAGRVGFVPGDSEFRRRSRSGAPSCLIAFGDECADAVRRAGLGVCADLAADRQLSLEPAA